MDLPEVKVRFTADTSQLRAEIDDIMAQIKQLTEQAREAGVVVASAIEQSLAAGLAQIQQSAAAPPVEQPAAPVEEQPVVSEPAAPESAPVEPAQPALVEPVAPVIEGVPPVEEGQVSG